MLNPEIKTLLLSARPFQYLEPHELDMLINFSKIITYADKTVLMQQGKISDGMYVIIEGKALIVANSLGKNAVNLAILNDGNFFGEVSLIEKSPATGSVIAEGQLKCFHITAAYFDMLALFFPETRYKITKAITEEICDRLVILHDKIIEFMKEANMASYSIFGKIIKSFIPPEPTAFEAEKITPKQIQALPFFKLYGMDEFVELIKHCDLIRTASNCPLINEGDLDTPYFIIIRGAVEASMTKHNKVAKISVLGPQSLFGSASYVIGIPSIINYSTCEKTVLLKITSQNLSLLQKNNLTIWYKLVESICKSFVALERSTAKLYIRLNSESYNR
jgi:CRP/FNR family transcriptional regulator, cyclic AMP receptor protein